MLLFLRFRAMQGRVEDGHFDNLRQQLNLRANTTWICGGDINATTSCEQLAWNCADPLDAQASDEGHYQAELLWTPAQFRPTVVGSCLLCRAQV